MDKLNHRAHILKNVAGSISVKTVLLVLVMFVAGLGSGALLLPYLVRNIGNSGTSGNSQDEVLSLTNQHFWSGIDWTEAAIVAINNGSSDAVLTKMVILGFQCNWTDVYYWKGEIGPVINELNYTSAEVSGSSSKIVIDGTERVFQQAQNELTLPSR